MASISSAEQTRFADPVAQLTRNPQKSFSRDRFLARPACEKVTGKRSRPHFQMENCNSHPTVDVNNGTHNVGLAFAPVNVDLSDFVIFNYLILNSGHADQKQIDDQLTGFAKTLADKGVQAAKDAISKGATALVGAAIGSAVMPLIGTILGMIAGVLVGALTGLIFVNCDGPVAAEQVALTGVQLRRETLGGGVVTHQTSHPGVKSNDGCGGNSRYKTTWSYRPVHSL